MLVHFLEIDFETSWAVGLTYWIVYLHFCFILTYAIIYVLIHHIIFTRGQFWPSGIVVAPVRPSVRHQVCQRDNSSPVQARITKFRPKMQHTLFKVPIVLGGNQAWPSRSNLRSKSKLTPFWVCPHHYSSPIQARITKFGPEVQNILVKIPIVLGGNWRWPSGSNLTYKV